MPHPTRRLAAAVVLAAVLGPLAGTATAGATAPTVDRIQAAAGWLATQFVASATHLPQPDGDHFESKYGSTHYADYGANADAVFGLVASGTGGSKVATALDYLAAHLDEYADLSGTNYGPYDGSIAKTAVAAQVAGRSTTDFGGHDLLAALKADECPADATTCTPGAPRNIYSSISASFVLLAEARAGGAAAPSAEAVDYFLTLQCADGGFTSGTDPCGSGSADVDATSYAVMALAAAGGHPSALHDAADWLVGQRATGGYWVAQHVPNTNATGLATAALAGVGTDVTASRSWLRAQQVPAGQPGAGALRYAHAFTPTTTSATSPSVLATAQGLTGLAAHGSLADLTGSGLTSGTRAFAPAAALSASSSAAGRSVTVTGTGFAAGELVRADLHSAPVRLGVAKADPSGRVELSVPIPAATVPGRHHLVLTGQSSGLSVHAGLTIVPTGGATDPVDSTTPPPTGGLADTGADRAQLTELALLAGLAITAGVVLLAAARRRGRHCR